MLKSIRDAVRAFFDLRLVPQQMREVTTHLRQRDDKTRLMANAERVQLLATPKLSELRRLEQYGYKGFSQNDEDGILQEIFRRIHVTNRQFVEFGTGDGSQNNTVFLLCNGWTGLWIDGNSGDQESQRRLFPQKIASGQLVSICRFLTIDNINHVIESAGINGEIDLLSIDVDGNDYHLWKAIKVINPRAVVMEYNAYAAPPLEWVMPYDASYCWDGSSQRFGASLKSLELLGADLGYQLVGCNLTGLNAFFVRKDLTRDLFPYETTAESLYQPRRWWLDVIFQDHTIPIDAEAFGNS